MDLGSILLTLLVCGALGVAAEAWIAVRKLQAEVKLAKSEIGEVAEWVARLEEDVGKKDGQFGASLKETKHKVEELNLRFAEILQRRR